MKPPEPHIPANYRLAIRRPVTTAMLFLTLVVFGWRSYQNLPVNLMPDISYPSLTVRTEYEGAAPEDVETLITRPIEELLSIVSGLVEISSVSAPGLSEIMLEFNWGADMNVAQQEVRDRLDLFDLPRDVTRKPVILRYDPTLDPVMRIAIVSNDPGHAPGSDAERAALTAIREASERRLKGDLEAEDGIAQARVKGGREEEIQVLLDVERIKALGITPQFVISMLAQQNINLSGGRLREGDTEYLVRTINEFATVDEIAGTIITTPGGAQASLRELARVFQGVKDRETIVHINGREAVAIDVFKEGDANTIDVCNRLRSLFGFPREPGLQEFMRAFMNQSRDGKPPQMPLVPRGMFMDRLPRYAEPRIISDQSRFIRGAIGEVRNATALGGVLALAVLFLFLRTLRSTVIVGLAIPISVVTAFIPMFFRDISLNIMSLGGLALGVGMMVDNSIVVLESIFRCREEGDTLRDAAERGTREVAGAVMASTLTTICVFLPVAFVEGVAGQLFGDLALTVTFSLSASLLVALYLIPLVASRSGTPIRSERHVVWLVRAWRDGRHDRGWGSMKAFLGLAPLGAGYAAAAVEAMWDDCFGPSLAALRRLSLRRPRSWFVALFVLVCLPMLAVLFLCRFLLATVTTCCVTALFFWGLALRLGFLSIKYALTALLYAPLRAFQLVFEGVRLAYGVVLGYSLRFSSVFLALTALIAAHAGYVAAGLGRELLPPMRQGEFGMRMEIRAGARLEETEARARVFEEIIRSVPEVESVTVEVGRERRGLETDRGENVATFTALLKDPSSAAEQQDDIIDGLRARVLEATRAEEEVTFFLPTLFSFRNAIEIQIVGDSLSELRHYGNAAVEALGDVDGLFDARLNVRSGYPELLIEMDRELLAARGLSPGQVAQQLRAEIQGEVATRFSRGADKIDIRVRADRDVLRGVDELRRLAVNDGPAPIPLADVARLRVEEGPSEIRRVNQRRTVVVSANVEGRDLGAVSADIDAHMASLGMPSDMYYLQGGQRRELDTAFTSLRFALLLAMFLVYVVMACQFESLVQPALVMVAAPLAFIGVVYTLHASGTHLSVMVFLGGIVLTGIVVNDAIILVDYINQLRRRGMSRSEAIVEAGKARLRPIIMTTVTSVLGLAPMLLGAGDGAEMRRPMALTLVSGLTTATLLTLFIIPMACYIFSERDRA